MSNIIRGRYAPDKMVLGDEHPRSCSALQRGLQVQPRHARYAELRFSANCVPDAPALYVPAPYTRPTFTLNSSWDHEAHSHHAPQATAPPIKIMEQRKIKLEFGLEILTLLQTSTWYPNVPFGKMPLLVAPDSASFNESAVAIFHPPCSCGNSITGAPTNPC